MNSNQYVSVPEPVDWRQGMLISPQHFQQQDVYVDRLTTHKMFVSQPHYWGLTDIEVSESDLRSNRVVIESLKGILRDGQIIELGNGAKLTARLPEPKTLKERISEAQSNRDNQENSSHQAEKNGLEDSILVSIGVFRSGASTDEGTQNRPQQRFSSFNCPDVADENNANLTIDMRKKRVLVQIFLGENIPGIYETIPLFRLVSGHNGYRLLSLHPPIIDAKVSKKLFAGQSLWAKTESLVTSIRSRAADMAGTNFSRSSEAQAMSVMLSKVPALEVLLSMEMVHPFQLYMAVVDLAAAVSAISLANKPLIPPGYDHNRPEKGFDVILPKLMRYVERIKPDFTTYLFDNPEPGKYEIDLPEGVNLNELVIKLQPEEGLHSEAVSNWLKEAKISSDKHMPRLRKARLRGLVRQDINADRRKQLNLPSTGLVVCLLNGLRDGLIADKATLQIQGDRNKSPEQIYLCVPRPEVK